MNIIHGFEYTGLSVDFFLWGVLATVTHVVIGWFLVYTFTDYHPKWGAFGGLFPDFDVPFGFASGYWEWFPFVHRGFVHTPVFMVVCVIVLIALGYKKKVWLPFSIGFFSHLVIDTFSHGGIMWFWPVDKTFYEFFPVAHDPEVEIIIFILVILLLILSPKRDYLNY